MRYAIVESGIAVNVIVSDEAFAQRIGAVLCPDGYGIGDLFDGEAWTKSPEPDPQPTE